MEEIPIATHFGLLTPGFLPKRTCDLPSTCRSQASGDKPQATALVSMVLGSYLEVPACHTPPNLVAPKPLAEKRPVAAWLIRFLRVVKNVFS